MRAPLSFALPAHDRKLLPDGRFSGTMSWVMAIMLFLTLLTLAAAISIGHMVRQSKNDLSQSATLQLLDADPSARKAMQLKAVEILRTTPGVVAVKAVSNQESRVLLEPWLGEAALEVDIPIPALVDISFNDVPDRARLESLRRRLASIAPSVRIDSHVSWMKPFFDLMNTFLAIALSVVFLLLLATAATVVLSVRSALNTHRATIDIMHMMGATDKQASRLFQRRIALDALFGGLVGLIAAAAILWLLGDRFAELGAGAIADASMPLYGWVLMVIFPFLIAGLAMLTARWTVLSSLKKML